MNRQQPESCAYDNLNPKDEYIFIIGRGTKILFPLVRADDLFCLPRWIQASNALYSSRLNSFHVDGPVKMIEGEEKIITHCPICGHLLPEPMQKKTLMFSFSICDCCGCEYGADDTPLYREAWLRNGAPWFNGTAPQGWDVSKQLEHAQMDWNIDVEQL